MRIGPQPRGRRGTVGHPYSALNLRLVLALFGLVTSAVLAVLAFAAGYRLLGLIVALLAVTAVIDLGVILIRRRARSRQDGESHSLFE